MSDDWVLRVEQLSKCFHIYANPRDRLREWISFGKRMYYQPFWALQDISFTVKRGEFLGIIGQNGAGKSTLLKILSGILQATSGTYNINGRLLSMLDLGMDFNPYLTGRQNVTRSAELLGFPNGYAEERVKEISEFAELGEFFDRPVRLYSTGMSARLAFSMFAFLDCDVLILDEVLAVGDLFFRRKCYARLEELIAKNTTILFVTHQMDAVQHYCTRAILIDKGQDIYQGGAREAIREYHRIKHGGNIASIKPYIRDNPLPEASSWEEKLTFWPSEETFRCFPLSENGDSCLKKLALCNSEGETCLNFEQGEEIRIYGEFLLARDIGVPVIGVEITNQFNALIYLKSSLHFDKRLPLSVREGESVRFCYDLTLNLRPGEYVLRINLRTIHAEDYVRLEEIARDRNLWHQKILPVIHYQKAGYFTVRWRKSGITHWGLSELPGEHSLQVIPKV